MDHHQRSRTTRRSGARRHQHRRPQPLHRLADHPTSPPPRPGRRTRRGRWHHRDRRRILRRPPDVGTQSGHRRSRVHRRSNTRHRIVTTTAYIKLGHTDAAAASSPGPAPTRPTNSAWVAAPPAAPVAAGRTSHEKPGVLFHIPSVRRSDDARGFTGLGDAAGDLTKLGVGLLRSPGQQRERLVDGQLVTLHQDPHGDADVLTAGDRSVQIRV